ncbi:hypothetical protein GGR56DRAFT_680558 [Xylariaceae sp. FL0804]|nr:hypothetical protein GGR56DRAFT_680558 [Xylariaceae sp. FL0804]
MHRVACLLRAAILLSLSNAGSTSPACKCFPGDSCWPTDGDWAALNSTVGGRLVATVPLGSPCHDPDYDAERCAYLQQQWTLETIHMESSSSVMAPLFANASCDPFTPRDTPCRLGNYVRCAIAASGADDIAAGLAFATAHNVRLVVRNTGHDYLGRSTGAGALAIWTHHLKTAEVVDWIDDGADGYSGKAMRFGAGIQGFEAVEAAHAAGLAVVTGECPTVGVAGGYAQGGGHSALSTAFGLAADNTLAFDVVTADGALVTASPSADPARADLYWALSGGGGGTYGVVVAVTVRAHPDATVGGASFSIASDATDDIMAVTDAFHAALPAIVGGDAGGGMAIYYATATSFELAALTLYNGTAASAAAVLAPFLDSLAPALRPAAPAYTGFDSYRDHFAHYWGPLPIGNIGVGFQLFGGRLLPRDRLSTASVSGAARALLDMGATWVGVGLDVSGFGKSAASGGGGKSLNAVLPQWRDAAVHLAPTLPYTFDLPFADMVRRQRNITQYVQPILEAAAPGAGAYMNEADIQQTHWQQTFFGANYDALLAIKRKYDPDGMFYATVAVGSEAWVVDSDGRMCRSAHIFRDPV